MSQASIVSAPADSELPGFPPSSQVSTQYEKEQPAALVPRHDDGENPNASTQTDKIAENSRIQPRTSISPAPAASFQPPTMNASSSLLSQAPTEVDVEDANSSVRMKEEVTPPSSMPPQSPPHQQQQQPLEQSSEQPQQSQPEAESTVPTASIEELPKPQPGTEKDVVTPPNMQAPGSPGGGTVGAKRTATGAVKGLSSSLPNTPQLSGKSTADKTRIVELSSTLKTRLSYAMMKVQKGWQTQTIDQVEENYATARQIGLSRSPSMNMSPGSARSDPAARIGGLKREYSGEGITNEQAALNESQMSQATEIMPIEHDIRHQRHHSEQHHQPPSLTPQSSFSSVTGERTYESFWRDHTSNPHTAKYLAARGYTSPPHAPSALAPPLPDSQSRHLAPAAPIIQQQQPRPFAREHHPDSFASRRRRGAPPPNLQQSVSNLSAVSNFSTASTEFPITPTRPTATTHAMEQDAVESLMFLSSPGHSQKPSSQQSSQQPPHSQPQTQCSQIPSRSLPASQAQAHSNLIRRVWQSTGPGSSAGAETDDDGDSYMGDAHAPISEDDLDRELDNDALHRNDEDEDDDDDEEEVYAYQHQHQQQQHGGAGGSSGTSVPRKDGDRIRSSAEASAQIHEHRIKRIKKTIENVSAANRVKQAAAAAATGGVTATSAPAGHVSPRPPVIMAGDMAERAVRPVS